MPNKRAPRLPVAREPDLLDEVLRAAERGDAAQLEALARRDPARFQATVDTTRRVLAGDYWDAPSPLWRFILARVREHFLAARRVELALAEADDAVREFAALGGAAEDPDGARTAALLDAIRDARGGGDEHRSALAVGCIPDDEREFKLLLVEKMRELVGMSQRKASELVFGNPSSYRVTLSRWLEANAEPFTDEGKM